MDFNLIIYFIVYQIFFCRFRYLLFFFLLEIDNWFFFCELLSFGFIGIVIFIGYCYFVVLVVLENFEIKVLVVFRSQLMIFYNVNGFYLLLSDDLVRLKVD